MESTPHHKALTIEPAGPFDWCRLGITQFHENKLENALLCFQRAIDQQPDLVDAHFHAANVYFLQGNLENALRKYRQVLSIRPDLPQVHYNLALLFHDQGRFDKATDCYTRALAFKPNWTEALCGLASALQDQGRLNEAVGCYKRALSHQPNIFDAQFNLGVIFQHQHRYDDAFRCYANALRLKPDFADGWNNLGVICSRLQQWHRAISFLQQAVTLDPEFAQAYHNLGMAYQRIGQCDAAVGCYQKSLHLNPGLGSAAISLGNILNDQGKSDEAIDAYQKAIEHNPEIPEAHFNLGNTFQSRGSFLDAIHCFRRALQIKPDFAAAHNNLGAVYRDLGRYEEAGQCCRDALKWQPNMVQSLYNMGLILQLSGHYHEGLKWYQKSLQVDPTYAPARCQYLLSLPILYDTEEDILTYRHRYQKNLTELIAETRLDTTSQREAALLGVGSLTNFYLAYQGFNDFDLQRAYGNFVCQIMAASFPQWSQPRTMPQITASERIRIGYVSSFMREHTVGQFLHGWLKQHHRETFEVFCFHIGNRTDRLTERFQQVCDHFYQLGSHLEVAASRIVSSKLHILVFTDIGMYAPATQLAALRLAPVQCKGWGHPVTTGLPTIDYYLSSDLMEPQDGQKHYSEVLVRLPNLALVYEKPVLPARPKTRIEFSIKSDAFVYLMSQSLFKCLPQYDKIYPRIASRVPFAQFIFLAHDQSSVTEQFRRRLDHSFQAHGLRAGDFCLILPRLSHGDFLNLNLLSDVLLDPFVWSGGRTTLEGISCGLPVVTCPGQLMRGRHAFAMLTCMGATETVAQDKDDYVDIAVRLALDQSFFNRVKRKMSENQARLYHDTSVVDALEDFYRKVVNQRIQENRHAVGFS